MALVILIEPFEPPLTSLSNTTSTSSSLSSNQLHIRQPRLINILPPDVREDNMCNETICTIADGHNPSFSSSENYSHKCDAPSLPKNTSYKSVSVQTVVSVPVIEVVEQDTSWKEEMSIPVVGRDINLKCHTDTPPVCPLYQSLIKLIEHTEKHMQDQRTKKDDITQDKVVESSNSVDLYVTHDVTDENNFENIAAPLRETNSLPSQIHKRKQQIICEMKKKQEEREQRQKVKILIKIIIFVLFVFVSN